MLWTIRMRLHCIMLLNTVINWIGIEFELNKKKINSIYSVSDCLDALEVLVESGAKLNDFGSHNLTPLMTALAILRGIGNWKITYKYIFFRIEINHNCIKYNMNGSKESKKMWTLKRVQMVFSLDTLLSTFFCVWTFSLSYIHLFIYYIARLSTVKFLINHGADINILNDRNKSALYYAVRSKGNLMQLNVGGI